MRSANKTNSPVAQLCDGQHGARPFQEVPSRVASSFVTQHDVLAL